MSGRESPRSDMGGPHGYADAGPRPEGSAVRPSGAASSPAAAPQQAPGEAGSRGARVVGDGGRLPVKLMHALSIAMPATKALAELVDSVERGGVGEVPREVREFALEVIDSALRRLDGLRGLLLRLRGVLV